MGFSLLFLSPCKLQWPWGKPKCRNMYFHSQWLSFFFSFFRDDPDLDKHLKEQVRWGDPMAHLVKVCENSMKQLLANAPFWRIFSLYCGLGVDLLPLVATKLVEFLTSFYNIYWWRVFGKLSYSPSQQHASNISWIYTR